MRLALLTIALVGCSGAVAASIETGDDDPIVETDSGTSTQRPSGSSGSVGTSSSSSGEASSSSSSSSSGNVEDGGPVEPDASEVDAGQDASPAVDAGSDSSTEVDAGPPDPPECTEGETKCSGYYQAECWDGRWQLVAGEACCVTAGRYGSNGGGWYTDSVAFSQWRTSIESALSYNHAWNMCKNQYFGRLPTRAHVLSQILPGAGACTPPMDHAVYTENGGPPVSTVFYVRGVPDQPNSPAVCVDVTTGEETGCPADAKFFCKRGD